MQQCATRHYDCYAPNLGSPENCRSLFLRVSKPPGKCWNKNFDSMMNTQTQRSILPEGTRELESLPPSVLKPNLVYRMQPFSNPVRVLSYEN